MGAVDESRLVRTKESARAHSQVIDLTRTLMVRMLGVSASDDTGGSSLIVAYAFTCNPGVTPSASAL
jgi:hypothetical protein